jgi:DNA-binding transcriptional LysR family regulator
MGRRLPGPVLEQGGWPSPHGISVELVASDQTISLTHREADLAVRHGRPETGNLYVSRVGTIACAAYQSPKLPAGATDWITYAEEQSHYALARWIMATIQTTGGSVKTRASSTRVCKLPPPEPALVWRSFLATSLMAILR